MYKEIPKSKLHDILSSINKDKNLRPDGWTMKLFLGFFDLLGDDLPRVVEEVKLTEKVLGEINTTFIALIPKVDFLDKFKMASSL